MYAIKLSEDNFLLSYKKECGIYSYNELAVIEYCKPYIILRVGDNKFVYQASLYVILEKLPSYFQLVNRGTIINMKRAIGTTMHDHRCCVLMDTGEFYKISIRKVSMIKKLFILEETGEIR